MTVCRYVLTLLRFHIFHHVWFFPNLFFLFSFIFINIFHIFQYWICDLIRACYLIGENGIERWESNFAFSRKSENYNCQLELITRNFQKIFFSSLISHTIIRPLGATNLKKNFKLNNQTVESMWGLTIKVSNHERVIIKIR